MLKDKNNEDLTERDLNKVFYDDGLAWKVKGFKSDSSRIHWVRVKELDRKNFK